MGKISDEYRKPLLIIKYFLLVTTGLILGIFMSIGIQSDKEFQSATKIDKSLINKFDKYESIDTYDEVYHPYIKRMKSYEGKQIIYKKDTVFVVKYEMYFQDFLLSNNTSMPASLIYFQKILN